MNNKNNNVNLINTIIKYLSIFSKERKTGIYEPKLISKPNGKRILVLSPHFDDEVIGCGGTIAKHIKSGDDVSIIYFTDGTNSIPDIKNKKKIKEIRKNESLNAMKIMGVKNISFLDQIDGRLIPNKKSINMIIQILKKSNPDIVYLPWFFDNHFDHLNTNKVFFESCKNYGFDFNICAYEVWTPLIPNIIVDIGDVFELKQKALLCFKSQLRYNDYIRIFTGLNMYNTRYNLNGESYAEAFLYLSAREYFKLMNLL